MSLNLLAATGVLASSLPLSLSRPPKVLASKELPQHPMRTRHQWVASSTMSFTSGRPRHWIVHVHQCQMSAMREKCCDPTTVNASHVAKLIPLNIPYSFALSSLRMLSIFQGHCLGISVYQCFLQAFHSDELLQVKCGSPDQQL